MKQNRRPQRKKFSGVANKSYVDAMQDLRRSSAASPVPAGTEYQRTTGGSRGLQWLSDVEPEDDDEKGFWDMSVNSDGDDDDLDEPDPEYAYR